ncbi:unnamed protein product [Didymodactylos carnosus]|uniref:Uncharacterized protein n=1 Tax=Didymodactylos carnosus TaxID=1234261 RepID=A0A814MW16_9BILA|nr:unnamed protein product [Didymodactylos carnosus]CAF3849248.1 unnamed protein product [Didymodactylos carnosus]
MVYSRSETNLSNIFINLCTSPNVIESKNLKQNYQRCYPPLKPLTTLRSNSCSGLINEPVDENIQKSNEISCGNIIVKHVSFDDSSLRENQVVKCSVVETDVEHKPLQPFVSYGFMLSDSSQETPSSLKTSPPLCPMVSTGFNIETKSDLNTETKTSSDLINRNVLSSVSMPDYVNITSQRLNETKRCQSKQSDYTTHRLQSRYKSREHLRKSFLS